MMMLSCHTPEKDFILNEHSVSALPNNFHPLKVESAVQTNLRSDVFIARFGVSDQTFASLMTSCFEDFAHVQSQYNLYDALQHGTKTQFLVSLLEENENPQHVYRWFCQYSLNIYSLNTQEFDNCYKTSVSPLPGTEQQSVSPICFQEQSTLQRQSLSHSISCSPPLSDCNALPQITWESFIDHFNTDHFSCGLHIIMDSFETSRAISVNQTLTNVHKCVVHVMRLDDVHYVIGDCTAVIRVTEKQLSNDTTTASIIGAIPKAQQRYMKVFLLIDRTKSAEMASSKTFVHNMIRLNTLHHVQLSTCFSRSDIAHRIMHFAHSVCHFNYYGKAVSAHLMFMIMSSTGNLAFYRPFRLFQLEKHCCYWHGSQPCISLGHTPHSWRD